MTKKVKVKDYMSREVDSIPEHFTIKETIKTFLKSNRNTFPVTRGRMLVGFISAKELLEHHCNLDMKIKDIYKKDVVVAHPELGIEEAARVMFRNGYGRLPVVNDSGKLVGIISNTDIVRSHIERATPRKVAFIKNLLEETHKIKIEIKHYSVPLSKLRPTQGRIHEDELVGREYELKRGLAEPLVTIKRKTYYVLVDGHHRAIAAKRLKLKELDSYVLELSLDDIDLRMERNAKEKGLLTLDDIKIIGDSSHPLIGITERFFKDKKKKEYR